MDTNSRLAATAQTRDKPKNCSRKTANERKWTRILENAWDIDQQGSFSKSTLINPMGGNADFHNLLLIRVY